MRGEYPQGHIRYARIEVGDAVSGEYLQDHIRYAGPGLGDVESENVYKTIHDIRGRS